MTPTRALPRRALSGVAALALSFGGAVGAVATISVVVAPAAGAATTIGPVDSTLSDGATDSLRDVLENQIGAGDTVVLEAGATYTLDFCDEIVNALATSPGQISIAAEVTIEGNGATIEQTCPNRVLFTEDPITLRDVTITGGDENGEGGGLLQDSKSPIVLDGVTFTGNSGSGGGGVSTFGDVTMTATTFFDNEASEGNGGGLHVISTTATVTVTDSTFDQNHASQWGGGIEQDDELEELPESVGPTAAGEFNLTVTNSNVTGNTAGSDGGGGIDTEDPAEITIDHSTVSGNSGFGGGGIGAFDITKLHVNASTFSGNTSFGDGGAVNMAGLLLSSAAADEFSSADFTNSTVTGNTETAWGAVAVTGTLQLTNVTMTDNTTLGGVEPTSTASGRDGVGAQAEDPASANVAAFSFSSYSSVVALAHGGPNCNDDADKVDGGYNFSDDTTCNFTDPTSKVATPNDPVLGALANNGGPTATLLPLTGSPLLDAIPPAACAVDVDQRGITRPQGTGCDIGAVEVEVLAAAPLVVTPRFTG